MKLLGVLCVLVAAAACAKNGNPAVASAPPASAMTRTDTSIVVTSTAFGANGDMPVKYTCDGGDAPPPLQWKNVPPEAKELALVVFDPDVPNGGFVHWVAFKIPPAATSFPEGSVPAGVRQAKNGAGKASYLGPCPPTGKHHYQFTISALNAPIDLPNGADASAVRVQIASKSIAKGVLVGLYQRH